MKLNIAIVDDEETYRNQLATAVEAFVKTKGGELQITTFTDGDEITDGYKANYDIIFLDMQMRRLNGLDTAKYIRQYDENVVIVFLTNYSQYAIKGYEVNATAYLLKPLDEEVFRRTMKKIYEELLKNKEQRLFFNTDNAVVSVNVSDIRYVESLRHKMVIYTDEEEYNIWTTMQEMEEKLMPYGFLRCNRSYLVNAKQILGIDKNEITIQHKKRNVILTIGPTYRKTFYDKFAQLYL